MVTHVIAPELYGGAESVVAALASGERRAGAPVSVAALVPDGSDRPMLETLREAGVRVATIACGHRRYLAETAELERLLKEWGSDIVHTHVYHADIVGYLAARRLRLPVVATVHGFTTGDWKHRCYQAVDKWMLRRFNRVLAVSPGVAEALGRAGIARDRIRIVANGLAFDQSPLTRAEARAKLGLAEQGRIVGWVGRLSHEKGPDIFVRMMNRSSAPDRLAVMLGDGPERDSLGGSGDRVRIMGSVRNAGTLLHAFDVLALTSRTEGLPMILLEAGASGVPVVAFAVGGVPEIITGETGWLVRANDEAGFAAAIDEALANPGEAADRAARLRTLVTGRFGAEQWLQSVHEVYDSVRSKLSAQVPG